MHFLSRLGVVPSQRPERLQWNGSDAPGLHMYQASPRKVRPTKASEHLLTFVRRRQADSNAYVMHPHADPTPRFQEPNEMFSVGPPPPPALSPITRARDRVEQRKWRPGACGCAWQVKGEELPEFSARLNAALSGMYQEVILPEPGTQGNATKRKSELSIFLGESDRWYPNKDWGAAQEWGAKPKTRASQSSRASQSGASPSTRASQSGGSMSVTGSMSATGSTSPGGSMSVSQGASTQVESA